MIEVIYEQTVTARKDHRCMACEFLLQVHNLHGRLTPEEERAVSRAWADGWKIKKGQEYIRQVNKHEGDVYTFKARPDIHGICLKYDFYPED